MSIIELRTTESLSADDVVIPATVTLIYNSLYPGVKTTPRAINTDDSYAWAYLVSRLLPTATLTQLVAPEGDHALVKIGKLYYDAEDRLIGVKDWKALRWVKRNKVSRGTITYPTVAQFVKIGMFGGEKVKIEASIKQHGLQGASITANLSAYTWYRFKTDDKKSTVVSDIKGVKFELEHNTAYGALRVKAGVRIIDADNPKVFFILKEQRFTRLVGQSVKLLRPPIMVQPVPNVAPVEGTPKVIVTPNPSTVDRLGRHPKGVPASELYTGLDLGTAGPALDDGLDDLDDDGEPNRILDIDDSDYLQSFNDIDDLSKELFGHHLHEFDDQQYDDLDSISSTLPPSVASLSTAGIGTLGKAYMAFFAQNKVAHDARTNNVIAENDLIPIIQDLFYYLLNLGFDVTVLRGTTFKKALLGCSPAIEKWKMVNRASKSIKHLAVRVHGLVLDPCFKRLGHDVRVDNYPFAEFQRMWTEVDIVASPTELSKSNRAGLFNRPVRDLQIPTPDGVVHPSPTTVSLQTPKVPDAASLLPQMLTASSLRSRVTKIRLTAFKAETEAGA